MPLCSSLKRLGAHSLTLRLARYPVTGNFPSQWAVQGERRSPFNLYSTANHNQPSSLTRSTAEYDAYLDLVLDNANATPRDPQPEHVNRTRDSAQRPAPRFKPRRRRATTEPREKKKTHTARDGQQRGALAQAESTRRSKQRARARVIANSHRRRGVGPKTTSVKIPSRPSANFSSTWNLNLNKIAGQYAGRADKNSKGGNLPILLPQASEWTELLLEKLTGETGSLQLETLAREHGTIGRAVWAQVALWLLTYDKDRVIDFLLATHAPMYPPINYVEDCLQHMAEHADRQNLSDARSYCVKLVNAFCTLAGRENKERMDPRPNFIRLLLPHCTHDQVTEMYRTVKTHGVRLSPHTFHHISSYFAKNGHLEQGIDALLEAQAAGADIDSVSFRSNCSTLLRESIRHPGGMRMCLRLIDNLVKVGVKLTNQLCNIIMLNAVEARDLDTAFSVYQSLRDHGLKPDAYTYAILLKGCKGQIDNAEILKETIQDAIESGLVRGNEIISTEIVHCLARHHTTYNPLTAYATVVNAYVELFDSTPLQELGLDLPAGHISNPDGQPKLMTPSPHAINIVLSTYLQYGRTGRDAAQVYQTWRELVNAGIKPHASLATTTYTSLVFLVKFIQTKSTLLQATQVVKDMQVILPPSAKVIQHPPDVQIWSAFLHGFTQHGQMKLAEQVLTYMRTKGIEPNDVTWNTLLTGYAGLQDLDGLLGSLRRLEHSGAAFDGFTYGGLRRYKHQMHLRGEIERMDFERNMDFTTELRKGLGDRLKSAPQEEDNSRG